MCQTDKYGFGCLCNKMVVGANFENGRHDEDRLGATLSHSVPSEQKILSECGFDYYEAISTDELGTHSEGSDVPESS